MNATTKIFIGALATTALAWLLNGPMQFGAKCAAPAAAAAPVVAAPIDSGVADRAAVTPAAVVNCQADVDTIVKGKTINFANGSATLTPVSLTLIGTLAASLKTCDGVVVEIAGHTDARGGAAANMALSERRANAVAAALVAQAVPNTRMQPKGYGETRPLDPTLSAEADAKNRRIEFTVAAAPAR